MQSGIGFDIHRLVAGRPLVLGGVTIPFRKGLKGHSDADCLVHAVCDAILGAIGDSDMGEHFPDTDPRFKNISSLNLLKQVRKRAKALGFSLVHLDTLVIAQEPKLSPFKPAIRRRLAKTLSLAEKRVNVKAKTTEGLWLTGRSQGIASYAIATVARTRSPKGARIQRKRQAT